MLAAASSAVQEEIAVNCGGCDDVHAIKYAVCDNDNMVVTRQPPCLLARVGSGQEAIHVTPSPSLPPTEASSFQQMNEGLGITKDKKNLEIHSGVRSRVW